MRLWLDTQVQRLQLLLHKHWPAEQFPDLAELALANCGTVQKRDALAKATASLDVEQLRLLVCRQLGWVSRCCGCWCCCCGCSFAGSLHRELLLMLQRRQMRSPAWTPRCGAGLLAFALHR